MIDAEKPDQAIVFVRTKIRCEQLYKRLRDRGVDVKALHGDMSQGSRDGVMISFKSGRLPLLVATDVAARGLDISGITHIINFDVPTSPDVYVHRIGRTGRVGRSGRAITFYEPRQKRDIAAIERNAGTQCRRGSRGAHVAPAKVEERPRRHEKPHVARNGDEPHAKLIVNAGRARRDRGRRHRQRRHRRRRARRRGRAQRPRARPLRLPRGPRRRRRRVVEKVGGRRCADASCAGTCQG